MLTNSDFKMTFILITIGSIETSALFLVKNPESDILGEKTFDPCR